MNSRPLVPQTIGVMQNRPVFCGISAFERKETSEFQYVSLRIIARRLTWPFERQTRGALKLRFAETGRISVDSTRPKKRGMHMTLRLYCFTENLL